MKRRSFLKLLGGAAVTAAIAPSLPVEAAAAAPAPPVYIPAERLDYVPRPIIQPEPVQIVTINTHDYVAYKVVDENTGFYVYDQTFGPRVVIPGDDRRVADWLNDPHIRAANERMGLDHDEMLRQYHESAQRHGFSSIRNHINTDFEREIVGMGQSHRLEPTADAHPFDWKALRTGPCDKPAPEVRRVTEMLAGKRRMNYREALKIDQLLGLT